MGSKTGTGGCQTLGVPSKEIWWRIWLLISKPSFTNRFPDILKRLGQHRDPLCLIPVTTTALWDTWYLELPLNLQWGVWDSSYYMKTEFQFRRICGCKRNLPITPIWTLVDPELKRLLASNLLNSWGLQDSCGHFCPAGSELRITPATSLDIKLPIQCSWQSTLRLCLVAWLQLPCANRTRQTNLIWVARHRFLGANCLRWRRPDPARYSGCVRCFPALGRFFAGLVTVVSVLLKALSPLLLRFFCFSDVLTRFLGRKYASRLIISRQLVTTRLYFMLAVLT